MSQKEYIIKCVRKLLDSDIYAKTISDETGINIHVVRKLKNSEQTIENTNFDYIARLFDFYIEKQDTIEAQQDVAAEILSEKLPKNVLDFINGLKRSINKVNTMSDARVSSVYVYDKYQLDAKGNAESKESYIEVNETVALNKGSDLVSKPINIIKAIDSKDKVSDIKNLNLVFHKEKLIVELKKLKKVYGYKPKLFKYDDGSIGIKAHSHTTGETIVGIEKNYLDIKINEEV